MTNVNEAAGGAQSPLSAGLQAGLETISLNQVVTFNLYRRVVLPLDGYVFWVKVVDIAAPSGLFNVAGHNNTQFNQTGSDALVPTFQAKGSLHYITDAQQMEESSSSRNRMVFTAEEPVQNLDAINPDLIYIATFNDGGTDPPPANSSDIRFAFSSLNSRYMQAGLWHYTGVAVFQTMDSQVIDDPRVLSTHTLIVSNSLPAFLAFNSYAPPWPVPVPRPAVTLYPSFLVPDNIEPPFGTVHIDPAGTESWQTMPYLGPDTSQWSLAKDHVQITLYGCNNDVAQSLLYSLLQYSYDTGVFGVLTIPVVRDEKETQVELHALAQKKRITFDVSYNQADIRIISRQLIEIISSVAVDVNTI